MEQENNKRKKIIVAVIGILVLIVVFAGATYAFFSAQSSVTTEDPITIAKVDLVVEVDPNATHIKNIMPTEWNENLTQNDNNENIVRMPIKVTNKSTVDINYDLFLTPKGLSLNENVLDGDDQPLVGGNLADIKYKLFETTKNASVDNPIIEGNFTKGEARQKIVKNKEIKAEEEGKKDNIHNYILYIYIENKEEKQNQLQGIDFNLNIEVVTPSTNTLSEAILDKEEIIEEIPNFSESATKKGLFKLKGDIADAEDGTTKNIYYYRGAVENNYVSFGIYKDDVTNLIYDINEDNDVEKIVAKKNEPILWRIIRINDDGSVKLISQHNINSGSIWNSESKPEYINSEIKKVVDSWYDLNYGKTELDKLVLKTEFCNNKNGVYTQPTLGCAPEEDKITTKAGLINANEVVYAGGKFSYSSKDSNTTFIDNNSYFWTISSAVGAGLGWFTNYTCVGIYHFNDAELAARPVITISSEAVVASGDGSLERPYVVKTE